MVFLGHVTICDGFFFLKAKKTPQLKMSSLQHPITFQPKFEIPLKKLTRYNLHSHSQFLTYLSDFLWKRKCATISFQCLITESRGETSSNIYTSIWPGFINKKAVETKIVWIESYVNWPCLVSRHLFPNFPFFVLWPNHLGGKISFLTVHWVFSL